MNRFLFVGIAVLAPLGWLVDPASGCGRGGARRIQLNPPQTFQAAPNCVNCGCSAPQTVEPPKAQAQPLGTPQFVFRNGVWIQCAGGNCPR